MNKNEVYEVTIDAWSSDGGGVARIDGMAVFVAGAAPGDTCRVRILKTAKTHAFAKIDELLEPSKLRAEPGCPVYGKCGGCALRHVTYEAELEFKRNRVSEALERIGGVKCGVEPVIPSTERDGARNKATYQLVRTQDGFLRAGFFRRRSNDVISCERCPSLPETADLSARVLERASKVFDLGEARWLMWRGNSTGESQLCLVTRDKKASRAEGFAEFMRENVPGLVSLVHCHNPRNDNVILSGKLETLWGTDTISESICGAEFEISPFSFFQTNKAQAERLYEVACEFAEAEGKRVLELYCGIGTITLALARSASEVVGCEIVPEAVQNARASARKNGVKNVRFECADAGEMASRERGNFEVAVVDPPRKGLSIEALEGVIRLEPKRIVYVSCDPGTLARDVKLFGERGYRVRRVQPVDMFPGTEHVETVVLLSKEPQTDAM